MVDNRYRTYRTIQGDAFDGIAWKIWGHEHMARQLMEDNPEHMDVLVFEPGVELRVPNIQPATTVKTLPPWMSS